MQTQASKYVIIREDLEVDPLTVVTDGLKIGRLQTCDIVLNHPRVSRLHAGIKDQGGEFYLFNFSHSSGTTLNGRVVQPDTAEVIADGDALHVGPFFLHVERMTDALLLRVSMQVTATVGEGEEVEAPQGRTPEGSRAETAAQGNVPAEVSNALSLFWSSRKREAGKMQRLSPLRPHEPSRVLGKSRFNWTPTRDLLRPWPASVFVWGAVVVCALSIIAALGYAQAFSPAPVSLAHARTSLAIDPAVAGRPNANACTNCHTLNARMNDSCASCHRTESFGPSVIKPHEDAGIGCADCHTEHRGADFRPSVAALQTCASCHDGGNRSAYNGRRVGTPHGGTFGYPATNGKWTWKGLDDAEWAAKPEGVRRALERWSGAGDDARRSAQFHALHLHRVRAVGGLAGNESGEVSCSTCHTRFSPIVDRETPRTTCAKCHDGDVDARFNPPLLAADAPNCTSCHVQHTKGRRLWGASLLAVAPSHVEPSSSRAVSVAPSEPRLRITARVFGR